MAYLVPEAPASGSFGSRHPAPWRRNGPGVRAPTRPGARRSRRRGIPRNPRPTPAQESASARSLHDPSQPQGDEVTAPVGSSPPEEPMPAPRAQRPTPRPRCGASARTSPCPSTKGGRSPRPVAPYNASARLRRQQTMVEMPDDQPQPQQADQRVEQGHRSPPHSHQHTLTPLPQRVLPRRGDSLDEPFNCRLARRTAAGVIWIVTSCTAGSAPHICGLSGHLS